MERPPTAAYRDLGQRATRTGTAMRPSTPSGVASRAVPLPQGAPVVFVVDDDISVRESLELLIRYAGWQAEIFSSAQAFLQHPRARAPGCLVLDVNLPDLNGLDLQRRIAADGMDMPIIFITGYGDVPMTVRAMKAGAVEFLTKPFSDDVLLEAIRSAVDRSRTALGREAELETLRGEYSTLSRREREVMTLVVSGRLNKQIGAELGISEITVKAHRGRVMRKMNAGSLADLVNIAAQMRTSEW
jgi:FixJ family two-component response regulator